ncbi:DUF4129 domain-containing protein [Nocardioides flavescens]|nr:DUF4129 domain-containing protein [Nocardioides flavescens]
MLPLDAPLDPSGSDARSALRRELLRPEYRERDVVQQVLTWLDRVVQSGLDAASTAPPLSTLAAMVLLVALVAVLAWLVSQARRTARTAAGPRAVLTDEVVTAAQLRERAERALAAGRAEEAVVEGFRCLTVRQVERGRLAEDPGATAHEVATQLAAQFTAAATPLTTAAAAFDAVLYGDRPASTDQARAVLDLDDELGKC